MGIDIELSSLVVILVAVSAGAIVKGALGLGLPLLAIPVMATFLGVERAVLIMAVPTVLTNFWLIWEHRRHFRRPETSSFSPPPEWPRRWSAPSS